MFDFATLANIIGTFPSVTAKNASGSGSTDGTPLVAQWLSDYFGAMQAIMNRAGLTPNGVAESYTASQILSALKLQFGTPGDLYLSLVQNPATIGVRALILTGQVITIANYADLVAATYITDANNANTAYQAFYKCSDSGGVTRSTSGAYFKLPDFRGLFMRALDLGAVRNPNGAADFIGNERDDAFMAHHHAATVVTYNVGQGDATPQPITATSTSNPRTASVDVGDPSDDGTHGTPRVDYETRPKQGIIQLGIRY